MAEYIDRKAAIDVVAKWFKEINLNGDICIDGLISLPAADVVERKTGKWEDKGHDNIYQCSVCGDLWMGIGGYRFCPNCGAQMIGGDDDV